MDWPVKLWQLEMLSNLMTIILRIVSSLMVFLLNRSLLLMWIKCSRWNFTSKLFNLFSINKTLMVILWCTDSLFLDLRNLKIQIFEQFNVLWVAKEIVHSLWSWSPRKFPFMGHHHLTDYHVKILIWYHFNIPDIVKKVIVAENKKYSEKMANQSGKRIFLLMLVLHTSLYFLIL